MQYYLIVKEDFIKTIKYKAHLEGLNVLLIPGDRN